jgi:hypothetical protein
MSLTTSEEEVTQDPASLKVRPKFENRKLGMKADFLSIPVDSSKEQVKSSLKMRGWEGLNKAEVNEELSVLQQPEEEVKVDVGHRKESSKGDEAKTGDTDKDTDDPGDRHAMGKQDKDPDERQEKVPKPDPIPDVQRGTDNVPDASPGRESPNPNDSKQKDETDRFTVTVRGK